MRYDPKTTRPQGIYIQADDMSWSWLSETREACGQLNVDRLKRCHVASKVFRVEMRASLSVGVYINVNAVIKSFLMPHGRPSFLPTLPSTVVPAEVDRNRVGFLKLMRPAPRVE